MGTSNKKNKDKDFLTSKLKGSLAEHHKAYLGTSVPENYFKNSKVSILEKIKEESEENLPTKKQVVFYMQPSFKYIAAASLVLMISLTIWLQQTSNTKDVDILTTEMLAFTDDVLVESLLVDDANVDAFTANTLFEEVMVKAEIKEQEIDNLILNSLIVEDSLLDDYIKDELVETIIL